MYISKLSNSFSRHSEKKPKVWQSPASTYTTELRHPQVLSELLSQCPLLQPYWPPFWCTLISDLSMVVPLLKRASLRYFYGSLPQLLQVFKWQLLSKAFCGHRIKNVYLLSHTIAPFPSFSIVHLSIWYTVFVYLVYCLPIRITLKRVGIVFLFYALLYPQLLE